MTTAVDDQAATQRPVNVNVGVLGHVDSGKTHLVRVLSTQLSTAALDKNPQSQQRGITLDLGFSAFRLPARTADNSTSGDGDSSDEIQVTLVDCPGHASLFKTILGGVRIIDMVLLVVDVTKGLQPQTIESLLVAELAVGSHIVVALNKIDLLPLDERNERVQTVQRTIRSFLRRHFASLRDCRIAIVPVAAAPNATSDPTAALGIAELIAALQRHLYIPQRDASGVFSVAIDHCFAVDGAGTVLTGTVLSGAIRVGDRIELPSLQVVRTVKSLEVFRIGVGSAQQGDRVGIRVSGLDASLVERSVAIAPQSLVVATQLIVRVRPIAFFTSARCKSGAKLHATVGHTTVVATATFFKRLGGQATVPIGTTADEPFDVTALYEYVAALEPVASQFGMADDSTSTHTVLTADTDATEDAAASSARVASPTANMFVLLQLEQPVLCPRDALVVGSRLDLDPKRFACRLAFHGRVAAVVTTSSDAAAVTNTSSWKDAPLSVSLAALRIGRVKSRDGVVDKLVRSVARGNDNDSSYSEVLGRDMFAKDVDWRVYTGVSVLFTGSRVLGRVVGPFGKAGKFRIAVLGDRSPAVGERIVLRFVKLAQLRAVGAAAVTTKAAAVKTANGSGAQSKAARNLVQDDALLYPEAFAAIADSVVASTDTVATTELTVESAIEPLDDGSIINSSSAVPAAHLQEQSEPPRGCIERLRGETTPDGRNPLAIVTGLFASDIDAACAVGRRVIVITTRAADSECDDKSESDVSDVGEIEKPFGKAGKVRVAFRSHGGTRAREGDHVALCS